ncbi:MAG: M23 family peptidase [Chitinophagaceae bacterium]|nr:MAG: M23 family peptidase [Chitinophagaceae bacterium]
MNFIFRSGTLVLLAASFLFTACNTPLSLSSKKTAHEKYSQGLKDAGLAGSTLGAAWISAGEKSLTLPATVTLPYREKGFFPADRPSAAGFSFTAKKGEMVNIRLDVTPSTGYRVFLEIWQLSGSNRDLLADTDSLPGNISYEVRSDGTYTLRVQPELLQSVGYTLNIGTSPSLAFPVRSQDNPKASSFWGADRDGGRRSHEGVDIFAKKRTPAVAIADGRVTRVNENELGGKVVWMRPDGKDYTLYYAHLDSQMVTDGQRVRTGDVLGLIGNTGNARTTPAHLHFGIYASGGAVNPWPFINVNTPRSRAIVSDTTLAGKNARTGAQEIRVGQKSEKLPTGTSVRILAALGDEFRVLLPDGREGFILAKTVSTQPIRQLKLKQPVTLLTAPEPGAAVKEDLAGGATVNLLSSWNGFHFISSDTREGWISSQAP